LFDFCYKNSSPISCYYLFFFLHAFHMFKYREHDNNTFERQDIITISLLLLLPWSIFHSFSLSYVSIHTGHSDIKRNALLCIFLALSRRTECLCVYKTHTRTAASQTTAVGIGPTACEATWCRRRTSCDLNREREQEEKERKTIVRLLFSFVLFFF
jgi:hypothetical protein